MEVRGIKEWEGYEIILFPSIDDKASQALEEGKSEHGHCQLWRRGM